MTTDVELLRRYVTDRAEEAFAELVRRHLNLVYFAALRQVGGDEHLAKDIAQSVFTDLARKAPSLAEREVLASWLYTSTRFAAAKARRTQARRRKHETEAEMVETLNLDIPSPAESERLAPLIDEVMHELAEPDRAAVLLRFFEGRAFAEIGAALKISEDAARMRVERSLGKLHALLARRGVTSTAGALAVALTQQATLAAPTGLAASVASSAIASAGVAVGPAVTVVQFMSTSKFVAGGVGLGVALALGTAVYELNAGREAATALARTQSDDATLRAKLAETMRLAAEAEAKVVRAAADAETARAAEAAEKLRAAAAARAAREATPPDGDAFMARHREVKRLVIESRRASAAGTYLPLFKMLQLTPAQIERFKDLSVQGVVANFVGPKGELIRYSLGGDRHAAEFDLRELLGEESFTLYREFSEKLGPAWNTVNELAGETHFTATPLTAKQGQQMQRVLMEHRARVEWSSRTEYDWDAIMTRAAGILSPEQLTALGHLRAQNAFQQEFAKSRARSAAGTGK